MSELKKCPFCGGEAELKKYYPPFSRRAIVTVKCTSCRCNSGEWRRSDKAIESWNTRAYDVDKVVEQLEQYDFNDVVLLTGYEESLIRLFKHNIIEIVRKGGVE